MALSVIEQVGSRPVQNDSGSWSGTRSFVVYNDSSPLTTPADVTDQFGTGGLPTFRDLFPDAAIPLLAVSPSVTALAGHTDTWSVVWRYVEMQLSPVQQRQSNDVGYVDISGDARGEFVDTWRVLTDSQIASLTASGGNYAYGTPAGSFQHDIGGTSIDVAGEPVSRLVRMSEVQLSVVANEPIKFADLESFVGRRNSATFWGASKGKLLFLGASQRRIEEYKWSIGFRFLHDQQFHMRQAPQVNPDGEPVLGSYVNGGVHAQYVYFVQPYPEFANFYTLSPYLTGIA